MKRRNNWLKALAASVAGLTLNACAHAQHSYAGHDTLRLFDGKRYFGQSVDVTGPIAKLDFAYFNDKAASADFSGPGWLLCKDANFEGPCLVARRPVSDLDDFGLDDEISSARPLSPRNPYPHGTLFGVDWNGEVVFYEADFFGNLSVMDPHDAWGYGYGDGYTSGAYGQHGRYGQYNPYNPHYEYDPTEWTGYRGPRNADIVLYRDANFRGSALGVNRDIWSMSDFYFNDEVSSIEVRRGRWEVCTDGQFSGRCEIIDASISKLNGLRLNDNISSVRRLGWHRGGGHYGGGTHGGGYGKPGGQDGNGRPEAGQNLKSAVTLFEHSNYAGRSVGVNGAIGNLGTIGLNDEVSSIYIRSGRWEICEHPNYQGRCEIIIASQQKLNGLRLNDNISSIRPAIHTRYDTTHTSAPIPYMGPATAKKTSDHFTGHKALGAKNKQPAEKTYQPVPPAPKSFPAPQVKANNHTANGFKSVEVFHQHRQEAIKAAPKQPAAYKAPPPAPAKVWPAQTAPQKPVIQTPPPKPVVKTPPPRQKHINEQGISPYKIGSERAEVK